MLIFIMKLQLHQKINSKLKNFMLGIQNVKMDLYFIYHIAQKTFKFKRKLDGFFNQIRAYFLLKNISQDLYL